MPGGAGPNLERGSGQNDMPAVKKPAKAVVLSPAWIGTHDAEVGAHEQQAADGEEPRHARPRGEPPIADRNAGADRIGASVDGRLAHSGSAEAEVGSRTVTGPALMSYPASGPK